MSSESIERAAFTIDAYSGLGYVARMQNKLDQALGHHDSALKLAVETEDLDRQQQQMGMLGLIHFELGQFEDALEFYASAIKIAESIGDDISKGHHLVNSANVRNAQGRSDLTLALLRDALAIAIKHEHRPMIASITGNLGNSYYQRAEYSDAREHYILALETTQSMGDRLNTAHWHSNLGVVCAKLGHTDDARQHYTAAKQIYAEIGNHYMVQRVEDNMSLTLKDDSTND
jgi:tetratricopeptide (TPR) repeat protein